MAPIWEFEAPAMHRLIVSTFRFLALVQVDDTARVGYQLRHVLKQIREPGTSRFGDTEVVFADALKRAVRDGHLRADTDVKKPRTPCSPRLSAVSCSPNSSATTRGPGSPRSGRSCSAVSRQTTTSRLSKRWFSPRSPSRYD